MRGSIASHRTPVLNGGNLLSKGNSAELGGIPAMLGLLWEDLQTPAPNWNKIASRVGHLMHWNLSIYSGKASPARRSWHRQRGSRDLSLSTYLGREPG